MLQKSDVTAGNNDYDYPLLGTLQSVFPDWRYFGTGRFGANPSRYRNPERFGVGSTTTVYPTSAQFCQNIHQGAYWDSVCLKSLCNLHSYPQNYLLFAVARLHVFFRPTSTRNSRTTFDIGHC